MSAPRAASTARTIAILGGVHAAGLFAYTVLSWVLNLVKPLSVADRRIDFYRGVVEAVPGVGPAVSAGLASFDPVARPGVFLVAYAVPVGVATLALVALLAVLARRREHLDASSEKRVFAFGVAGALVCACALPVLADDFWLSVVWGRMLASGVNAYVVPMSGAFVGGTPFEPLNWKGNMTYGPAWAALSAAVMGLTGGRALAGAVAFKALLAAGWILGLRIVRSVVAGRPAWQRCVALAVLGWMPVGVIHGVADGHNDVFVALGVLVWLWALHRDRPMAASVALATSVAVKYVTAVLFLLDVLHHVRGRGRTAVSYAPRALAVAALFLAGVLPLHGAHGFLVHLAGLREWAYRFLTPREAVIGLERLVGLPLPPLRVVAVAAFPVLAAWLVTRYAREPAEDRLHAAALAVMFAALFGVVGYLWPWYVLWPLGVAALCPGSALGRWTVGLAVLLPFPVLIENAFPGAPPGPAVFAPALAFYAASLLVFVPAARGLFPHGLDPGRSK